MQIEECVTPEQVAATYPVMAQLRTHIAEADYGPAVARVLADGGRLIAAFEGVANKEGANEEGACEKGACIGCAVFRPQYRLYTGPMIYIDDLVTDGSRRSRGVGKALIVWVEAEARRLGAEVSLLDSGVQRGDAHRFYFREGYRITSFNFKKKL